MADIANAKNAGFGKALLAPFAAIGRFLVLLAEVNPKIRAFDRLSRISDAELAARGLTREGEIRRIMGAGGFM